MNIVVIPEVGQQHVGLLSQNSFLLMYTAKVAKRENHTTTSEQTTLTKQATLAIDSSLCRSRYGEEKTKVHNSLYNLLYSLVYNKLFVS
ncbi:PHO85 cyclin-6 [Trichinella pseudospiralis]